MTTESVNLEVYISAVKIGSPTDETRIRAVIDIINATLADDFPVQLAPYDYEEFIDKDRDNDEYGYKDRHDCFEFAMFAETLGDLWTTVNVLHRNGDNEKVRDLHTFLDQFILGMDCVDIMDSLDL